MQRERPQNIFDFHCHIFPDRIAEKASEATGKYYGLKMFYSGTVETLKASAAKAGVTHCLVCSAATNPRQVHAINDFIAGACRDNSLFYGFGSLHPYMDGIEAEAERMIAAGIRGVKLHADFQGFRLDDPKAYALYEIIEGRLPLLVHMGDRNSDNTTPEQLAGIVKRFPKLKVIGAHFGGYSVWDRAVAALEGTGVMVDTSSSLAFMTPERAAELVRVFGAEHCFFGTDYPMWDHTEELERFDRIDLSDSERKKILWENAAGFFNIETSEDI
ncbi:MAG: amidohydrolase family protein [Clostridiales bacterium]|nr:amidohydrolase family protein [Clostridiales bacterium]